MRVDCYYNLHTHKWSVRSCVTGRVILHSDEVWIRDAQFIVQPAGRERVRREGVKNVHAFVRGTLTDFNTLAYPVEVTYNPYLYDSFVIRQSGEPVTKAKTAYLTPDRKVLASAVFTM